MKGLQRFLLTLGPGILFASTAIGVSHLVQSTRAGAIYGFGLLWAILAANLLKYPFFEFGSRYAVVKGKSIIDGYAGMHPLMLWLYILVTVGTMFFVTAAVGAVTAGFLDNLFGLSSILGENSYRITTSILFLACILILAVGRYAALDKLIKIIASVLLITTLSSFLICIGRGPNYAEISESFTPFFEDSGTGLFFLIALMGWMPTAVDMSTWNSIWTLERIESSGYRPSLKETLREFNIGYWVSAVLALCFVTLGAYLIYGSGEGMPDKSHLFAHRVVQLYTESIGEWSYFLIASAGFSIMFGTCIAIFDGYSRTATRCLEIVLNGNRKSNHLNTLILIIVGIGGFLVVMIFGKSLKSLVDLATTISFLIAPIIAIANYRLVTASCFPKDARPGLVMHVLSIVGIAFLLLFGIYFIVVV